MPLGFERINERSQRPNALINFIRTIPGPSSTTAEQILNRVAAICYPFMKANMILIQALEEYPYNTEFVGRNFNAGEVIQLVLRDRHGRWLPQRMVEMVMVHELAHCKQMNHSKAFWKVRNTYAVDLRALWTKGYTGEGMWGRGRGLDTDSLQTSQVDAGDVPEHVCGGTYGRKSKKRRRGGKEKEILSYAEKKQRRILKKFGAGGQSLGADDETKVKLEGGIPKKGKPRVANSARGRDLRAAAALARLEPVKKEEAIIKEEEITSESETEDEYEGTDQTDAALDIDGTKLVDNKGRALIKICEDEDDQDGNARREMDEIQDIAPQQNPALELSRHKLAASSSDIKSGVKTATQSPSGSSGRTGSSARIVHLDEVWKRRSETAADCASKESGVRSSLERGACNLARTS
ncbi:hypothetical protein N0V94_008158 [Neodidymelliopsis sp. IMI 364377]|nr:hypothetical protein N0V94_008158 [Neodidymelliopsis sp. IMI 364377]